MLIILNEMQSFLETQTCQKNLANLQYIHRYAWTIQHKKLPYHKKFSELRVKIEQGVEI